MIQLRDLTISAGHFRLTNASLHVPQDRYAVLMGPTGCGKTTLLETICGLRAPDAGAVVINNRDVTTLDPADRGVGYVPQDGALFTTMTIAQQIAVPLRVRAVPRKDAARRVAELADLLEITKLLKRKPKGLSGGERQRVALARALSFRPHVLLLDEPLSALDNATRARLYAVIDRVRQQTRVTALHVTHSRAEAERLADLWFAFDNARIAQIDAESGEQPIARRESKNGSLPTDPSQAAREIRG